MEDNYIYIVYAENEGGFSQPYSSENKAKQAAKKLQSLKPEWNVLVHQRQIDDDNFWEIGHSGGVYLNKHRIKKCFDKQFILFIYFSLLIFLWFKIK